jgi:hypothetical protein
MERLSGATIPRNFVSLKELEADIAGALPVLQTRGVDLISGEGAIISFKGMVRQCVVS